MSCFQLNAFLVQKASLADLGILLPSRIRFAKFHRRLRHLVIPLRKRAIAKFHTVREGCALYIYIIVGVQKKSGTFSLFGVYSMHVDSCYALYCW